MSQTAQLPTWVIMPVLAGIEITEAAISDVLAQSVPVRLLVINQGVDDAFRDRLERLSEQEPERLLLWSHQPSLPSLGSTWNRALDCAWACGAEEALVVNNDVRLLPITVQMLSYLRAKTDALFVSAVGVTKEQFEAIVPGSISGNLWPPTDRERRYDQLPKGGPDFSCFLISRACHEKYRFDEGFIPAHTEDLDLHRRLMLGGDGQKIFSVNLPYLHLAAQTIAQAPPEVANRIRHETQTIARAYYARKWGGPVNAETFFSPFDAGVEGVSTAGLPNPPTTTALFDRERQQWQTH